jgi:hypothetical protein
MAEAGFGNATYGIGTPDELRSHLRRFQDAGVDQTVFIQQGGKNRHEHICEALELFATDVMPEFKEHEAERIRRKDEELAPYIEKAFKRKEYLRELTDDEIEAYPAYGYEVAEVDVSALDPINRARRERMLELRAAVERVDRKLGV